MSCTLDRVNSVRGGGMRVGGLQDLQGYHGGDSKSSLVQGLAQDMAKELKLKIKTSGEVSEIVRSMLDNLPDPRKNGNGKSFTDKKDPQLEACAKLAKIVNKHLGEGTVSTSANAGEQCEQIGEALYSLSGDMRGELAVVKKDAERIVKNLNSLKEMLRGNYELLVAEISKSEDHDLGMKTVVLEQTQKALLEEVDRQIGTMQRILDVQVPATEKDLAAVMKDNKEFKTLIRKIKATPGTGKFGEKVALTISGIGRTAAEAQIVEKALKEIGMTVDEYAKIHSFDELRDAVAKSLQDNLSTKSADKLKDWLNASSLVTRYFHDHDKILKELKSGGCDMPAQSAPTPTLGGLTLEKPIKKRQEVREGLLNAFNRRMGGYIEQVMLATESLAEGVGAKRIAVTDDLVKFTKALDVVPALDSRLNYYALSGYNRTVASKEIRETFLSSVKHLLAAIEKLQKNKEYSGLTQLKDMHAAWSGFTKLVRDFSTRFSEGFGAIVPKPGKSKTDVDNVSGGDDMEDLDEVDGGAIDAPEVSRIAYNLNRTKNVIKYYVRVGLVQLNMAAMAQESKEYNKDYIKILSDAVANLRDKNSDALASKFEAMKTNKVPEEEQDVQKEVLKYFANCDDKMFLAAEAVDMYLMHFTDSLVAHPNDIEALHTMLRTTDTLSKWYNERSGNLVCAVFESMEPTNKSLVTTLKSKDNKEHYYTLLAATVPARVDDQLTVNSKDEKDIFKTLMKDTHNIFDNVLALKNIMSAFFHIGDKFGGESLRKKIHLRPVEVYNALVDYMSASSFKYDDSSRTLSLRSIGKQETPDMLFEYCVKGIVSKILTVIGTYNMLHRPVDSNGIGNSTVIRVTLGAGESTVPVVHEDAMELYIRLPLLAEWYRDTFNFFTQKVKDIKFKSPQPDNNVSMTLSMVPEIDGVYSGLIDLIFMQSRNLKTGIYSDIEANKLVREINKIFAHHKSSKDPVNASIHGFINEINRRFGILRENERQLFKDEYNKRYENDNDESVENLNYAILPDGEESDVPRRSAPSDNMRIRSGKADAYTLQHKWSMGLNDKKMIDALRYVINAQLGSVKPSGAETLESVQQMSFDGAIRARGEELKNADGADKRFRLVVDAVNAFGEFSYSAIERSIILFHETVVLGLEALNSTHKLCREFNDKVIAVYDNKSRTSVEVKDLFNAVYAHASDLGDLVKLHMETHATGLKDDVTGKETSAGTALSIHLDYSKLKEVAERQVAFIKTALDRFRGLIPNDILKQYEETAKAGSVYYLEEHFVNVLLNNRGKIGPTDTENLDSVTLKLKEIFNNTKLDVGTINQLLIEHATISYPVTSNQGLGIYLRNLSKMKKPSDDAVLFKEIKTTEVYNTIAPEINGSFNGIIPRFNQLLAMYLKQFSNEANERVYNGVVGPIANGVFSQETSQVGANNYTASFVDYNGTIDIPIDAQAKVLGTSLAMIMYSMVNGKMSGQKELYYLENDLAEMPEFIREKYRASMPVFRKLFTGLARRCDLLKQLIKISTADAASILCLNKVIAGCEVVNKCIKSVLGEISDDQVFLDTRQGFAKDYMMSNGHEAFMPLSSVTHFLRSDAKYSPTEFPGTTDFKLVYGVRGVLCGESSMKVVPGMKHILSRHNEASDSEYHFTEAEIASHVENTLSLLNYCVDASHVFAKLSTGASDDAVSTGGVPKTLQSSYDALKTVELTESTHQNEQRLKIVDHIGRGDKDTGMIYGKREDIRNRNIIDMNVTPLNINALRREMPFLNLYNYSYTFDYMMCDLLEVGTGIIDNDEFITVSPTSSEYKNTKYMSETSRKILAWLTIHPYASLLGTTSLLSSTASVTTEIESVSTVPLPYPDRDDDGRGDDHGTPPAQPSRLDPSVTPFIPSAASSAASGKRPASATGLSTGSTTKTTSVNPGLAAALVKRRAAIEGDDGTTGGALNMDKLDDIFTGRVMVQGLGVPKFLNDELYNKVLLNGATIGTKLTTKTSNGIISRSKNVASNVDENTTLSAARFDSRLVRHLFWMVNVQRLLRLKMSRDLMWHTTKINKDVAVLAPGNTETFGNDLPNHNEEEYKY